MEKEALECVLGFEAAGGDAAREKVVDQTKLLDGSGVPKLLLRQEEEIFEHDLKGLKRRYFQDITLPNQNSC